MEVLATPHGRRRRSMSALGIKARPCRHGDAADIAGRRPEQIQIGLHPTGAHDFAEERKSLIKPRPHTHRSMHRFCGQVSEQAGHDCLKSLMRQEQTSAAYFLRSAPDLEKNQALGAFLVRVKPFDASSAKSGVPGVEFPFDVLQTSAGM
ncbi:hypothetical protein [Azohydromonas lata]|uniref:hypothetical protein n=1 Tax=Azohydromonas lata TaxID=45677 RepID=UPI0012F4DCBF|nr:hypothetical protein [Azohydromonas lata]